MDIDESAELLAELLRTRVKHNLEGIDELGLMFSGGVDSAVLAVTARKHCDVTLYVAGTEDSGDLAWGSEAGELLDLPLKKIIFTEEDVINSLKNVVARHKMTNVRWMSTFIGFDIVLGNVSERHVACGQGADELFGGYRKYRSMDDPLARMTSDLRELADEEFPAYITMARNYGKQLLAPFLDSDIVRFADTSPVEQKLGAENKQVLRLAADILGVPGSMASRPKKAMQYGSGVSKILKRHVKNSGNNLSGIINNI